MPSPPPRRLLIAAGALAVGVAVAAGWRLMGRVEAPGQHLADAPAAERPNVVLVIIDTLRADHVGAYGHPADATPGLDALADHGLLVETVVAPSTWTRPSIGALVTGQHPRTLGIYQERRDTLRPEALTLAEAFRAAGYTTLGATANPNINPYYGFDQGFDWYQGTTSRFDWMPDAASDGPPQPATPAARGLPSDREMVDDLLAAVDRHPQGPHYLQLNLMDVHEFLVSAEELPADVQQLHAGVHNINERRYLQALTSASREVTRLARALYARPGWQDTLLVVTSDHGETLNPADHPSLATPKWHGHLVYEDQALVPLVLYNPRDARVSGRITEPTGLIDLAPTLLDYAGLPPLADRDGVSWWTEAGPSAPPSRSFVVETFFRSVNKIARYDGAWRYIENRVEHPGAPPLELQPAGGEEDGALTSQADAAPDEAGTQAQALAAWEVIHPRTPAARADGPLPAAIQQQLEAIGYLE